MHGHRRSLGAGAWDMAGGSHGLWCEPFKGSLAGRGTMGSLLALTVLSSRCNLHGSCGVSRGACLTDGGLLATSFMHNIQSCAWPCKHGNCWLDSDGESDSDITSRSRLCSVWPEARGPPKSIAAAACRADTCVGVGLRMSDCAPDGKRLQCFWKAFLERSGRKERTGAGRRQSGSA